MTEERQNLYYNLIDQLLQCPSGQEPEVLNASIDLIDAGLVSAMVQVASILAHENNGDAARFLVHTARELSKQLGLYPQTEPTES